MNKYRVLIICLLFGLNLRGQGQTWREIPYYLKGYEVEYAKSPKEAALAWFKDARFGCLSIGDQPLCMEKENG